MIRFRRWISPSVSRIENLCLPGCAGTEAMGRTRRGGMSGRGLSDERDWDAPVSGISGAASGEEAIVSLWRRISVRSCA